MCERVSTWPLDEVTVAQPPDLHAFEEEDGGGEVGLQDAWSVLSGERLPLGVQTKALPWKKKNVIKTCIKRTDYMCLNIKQP